MKILYIDHAEGLTEGGLAGAMMGLFPEKEEILAALNGMGIPEITFSVEDRELSGNHALCLSANLLSCREGRQSIEVEHLLRVCTLPEKVKQDIRAVSKLIGRGKALSSEEMQTTVCMSPDSFGIVAAICLMIYKLGIESVTAKPVCLGGRSTTSMQAAAKILEGTPAKVDPSFKGIYSVAAVAILRHFVKCFSESQRMTLHANGCGWMNTAVQAGCIWVFLGEVEPEKQEIVELSCNVDDMTGEMIGFALERFLAAGALEAYTTAVGMKKSRPGVKICVLCRPDDKAAMAELMFRHTTTLGIREAILGRYTLQRMIRMVQTPYGAVRRKDSFGYGVFRSKLEYDDLAEIARRENTGIDEILGRIGNTNSPPSE